MRALNKTKSPFSNQQKVYKCDIQLFAKSSAVARDKLRVSMCLCISATYLHEVESKAKLSLGWFFPGIRKTKYLKLIPHPCRKLYRSFSQVRYQLQCGPAHSID